MRVLFWGTPEFAVPSLRALGGEGHDVVAVVTQPDRPAGRGRALAASPVKAVAEAEGLPVLQPERARGDAFLSEIRALEPDVSVVAAYGQILPVPVLEAPPLGSWNVHASLLPALRGAAPVHAAILHGLPLSGVSIMKMEAGLDSGPVVHQVPEPIRPEESMSELAARLAELGAEALVEALALVATGQARLAEQDHAAATYAPKIGREQARLDWNRPAEETARRIRAMDAVPGAWTLLGPAPVKLFRPTVAAGRGRPGEVLQTDSEAGLLVAAGDGALRVREVQPPGKRRMRAGEWVRGRGVEAGDRFV